MREAIAAHNLSVVVEIVSDGEKAIRYIADAQADPAKSCPDCILVDLNLPKGTGFEVLERLRKSPVCAEIPVVIMTSSNADTDRSRAAALGASFFQKPSDYDEFLKLGGILKEVLAPSDTRP